MSDGVRRCLPWWWGWAPERPGGLASDGEEPGPAEVELEQMPPGELLRHWTDLGNWVSWFVDRYHPADVVPPCWPRHPALVDELITLWYYHQEVTRPLVSDLAGPPDDAVVPASAYWEWHEARRRWTQGALRTASGCEECVAGHRHVEEPDRRGSAAAFTEAASIEMERMLDGQTDAEVP